MARRRRKRESSGGGAYWMDTYGDMVTLLLTFFVLLYSFSTVNEEKWKDLVSSFQTQFGKVDESDSNIDDFENLNPSFTLPPGLEPSNTDSPQDVDHLYIGIRDYIKASGMEASIGVTKTEFEIVIRFLDSVMFDSGRADLKPESLKVLDSIADVLLKYNDEIKMVRIEGHTDNVPIHNSRYDSNWELSTTRAVQVLKHLVENESFHTDKISAVGYGEYHPITENNTDLGRSKNRRVDFVITRAIEQQE